MGILWVFYLYLMGLGLGSVAWDKGGLPRPDESKLLMVPLH